MKINGTWYRTIWRDGPLVRVIDQRALPHRLSIRPLETCTDVCEAVRSMTVRGAGLIGAAGGYAMWLAACEAENGHFFNDVHFAAKALKATRPTASNLARAVDRQLAAMSAECCPEAMRRRALVEAEAIADEDAAFCRSVGKHGLKLIRALHEQKRRSGCADCTVHVLTHCNAGWLAFVDYGSALSPVYAAFDAGLPVHVWVDETRPCNQGAALTAFELGAHGVPYHIVVDNAGGHLMQHDLVDLVIVGADRVTRNGDVANKIGTYLKALAARDNGVPFYVALPSSTFDFSMRDGIAEIPIEERGGDEVLFAWGVDDTGVERRVRLAPEGAEARNWGFDVTPAQLVTGLITERGICKASGEGILRLFPEGGMQAADGVVKFRAVHAARALSPDEQRLAEGLDRARRPLHETGLIGETPEGIGYGNLSIRKDDGTFLVTGTATGRLERLLPEHFACVVGCDAEKNTVSSEGPSRPSSESMTHGAVYEACPDARSVIHVHCPALFHALLKRGAPQTPPDAAYGTPAMAQAVRKLAASLGSEGVFVTPGHENGIFAFGPSLERIAARLLALFRGLESSGK